MTLSFSNLNEIGNLYESIAASDQEQLNEGAADVGAGIRKAVGGAVRNASDIGGSALRGLVGQKTTSSNPISKLANTYTRVQSAPLRAAGDFTKGLVTGQGDSKPRMGPALPDRLKNAAPAPSLKSKQDYAASKGKYFSSSDNKTYANYGAAKAAHDARVGASASGSNASRPAAAAASTPAKPSTQMAKTAPAKPAIPTGTTAGGTTFQRRAATSAELAAAQAARAAGKGEEGAIKAGVAASKPVTVPQATAAAPSTSASASGSLVPATNKLAAASKPVTMKSSYEYDAYDLVLEYLLDNGHVDTVEEAHYVMMELDAEVIQDIVEEVLSEDAAYDRNRRRAAQRAQARNEARARGQTGSVPGVGYVSPRPERATYTDSAGVVRHHTGARMPEKKG